ncbi:hypothetical protein NCTGTJJY_CDS0031 [Serratia phage 92A1]|nr:hypothetical protein NCTGTJJY_CDS0031 [Serratia phage 92A1]
MIFKRFPKATAIIKDNTVSIDKVGYKEPLVFDLDIVKVCIAEKRLSSLSNTLKAHLYFSIDEAAEIVLWIREALK